jgi:hypothetical protein
MGSFMTVLFELQGAVGLQGKHSLIAKILGLQK